MRKHFLFLITLALVALLLCACNSSDSNAPQTEPDDEITQKPTEEIKPTEAPTSKPTEGSTEPEFVVSSNMVMANDQLSKRLVIYDIDAYEEGDSLDDLEVWAVDTGHAAGLKYREDTVFGDVIIVAGSTSAIYSFPSGRKLWRTNSPGKNPHSVELLPSGNLVIASSTGGTVRLFYTSYILDRSWSKAEKYVDYTLEGAHGVLWDPEYRVLWALGNYELKAYRLQGEGHEETLVEDTDMTVKLPEGKYWGHDLSPDYTDTRYLYITVGSCVMRVDKEEGVLIEDFQNHEILGGTNIKGFSNNPDGSFFIAGEAGGEGCSWQDWGNASWCTDSIYFCYDNGGSLEKLKLTSTESAFYKVRSFCGRYQ